MFCLLSSLQCARLSAIRGRRLQRFRVCPVVCRAHVWAGEGEFPNFRPREPVRDTWGWWGECGGNSQLVWEFQHPPFPPYCAFLLGVSRMVFPDTSPTCVFGGRGFFRIDQPVRAASLAPHGHPYDVPEVSLFPRRDTKLSFVCSCCRMTIPDVVVSLP